MAPLEAFFLSLAYTHCITLRLGWSSLSGNNTKHMDFISVTSSCITAAETIQFGWVSITWDGLMGTEMPCVETGQDEKSAWFRDDCAGPPCTASPLAVP